MKLRMLKNSTVLISKMAIVFFKFQPEISKYEIFFENFFFFETFFESFFFANETLSELNFI